MAIRNVVYRCQHMVSYQVWPATNVVEWHVHHGVDPPIGMYTLPFCSLGIWKQHTVLNPPTSPEVGLPLKGLCWVYLILHFDLPLFILLADSSCFEAWQPRKSNAARRRSTKPKWIHMPYATVYYQYIPMKSYRFAFPVGRLPVFLVRFFFSPDLFLNWNRGLLDIRLCP